MDSAESSIASSNSVQQMDKYDGNFLDFLKQEKVSIFGRRRISQIFGIILFSFEKRRPAMFSKKLDLH